MRLVRDEQELLRAFDTARGEALAAFQNDAVYLEKYLTPVRHVEVQLLGDNYGQIVHFGERECSLQHKHQKVIEECPSPAADEQLRLRLGPRRCGAHRQWVTAAQAPWSSCWTTRDSSIFWR